MEKMMSQSVDMMEVFWNWYQDQACRTLNDKGKDLNVLHCVLGMAGELGEIDQHTSKQNLIEELGDFMWYAAVLCSVLELRLGKVMTPLTPISLKEGASSRLLCAVSTLVDKVKRKMFYNKELNEADVIGAVAQALAAVTSMAEASSLSMQTIAELNIRKLSTRYPGKFNVEDAIVRNLAAEKAVFE